MPVSDDQFEMARQAKVRLEASRAQTRTAEDAFHDAVRGLHAAGASVEDTARALDISEQAARRILGLETASDLLHCNFCGLSQKQVKKIIAGPGTYICDGCVLLATAVLQGEEPDTTLHAGGPAGKCGFCGKSREQVGGMVSGPDTKICDECLELCREINDSERD